jgi:hypothetical protein
MTVTVVRLVACPVACPVPHPIAASALGPGRTICCGLLVLGHNSSGEWAVHLPPGGQHLPTDRYVRQNPQLLVLEVEQRAERRLEQVEVEVEVKAEVKVEVKVQTQVEAKVKTRVETRQKTGVLVQASTRLRTLLHVPLGELLRILHCEHEVKGRAQNLAAEGWQSAGRPSLNCGGTALELIRKYILPCAVWAL